MWRKRLPYVLMILIGVIGLINSLAIYNSWYWKYRFLDIPMHFLGGLFIAVFMLWLVLIRGRQVKPLGTTSKKKVRLLALISVLIIGLSWEVFEFRSDVLIIFAEVFSWADTASDILFDLIGATLGFLWFEKHYYNTEESLVKKDNYEL